LGLQNLRVSHTLTVNHRSKGMRVEVPSPSSLYIGNHFHNPFYNCACSSKVKYRGCVQLDPVCSQYRNDRRGGQWDRVASHCRVVLPSKRRDGVANWASSHAHQRWTFDRESVQPPACHNLRDFCI